jgi:hypothetical protein
MTTLQIRSVALGVLVVALAASTAAAQTASPILNVLEVRTLVASTDPADHSRLSTHFTAVAERYAADARRHTAMAQAYGSYGGRRLSTDPATHCRRLAELASRSAEDVRALAAHHQKLAQGIASVPPKSAAKYQAGAGAAAPSERDLLALAAKAGTPAEHAALEEYHRTLAKDYSADAETHVAMAGAYRTLARTPAGDPAAHCDRLVRELREAAAEARVAADNHKEMAGR